METFVYFLCLIWSILCLILFFKIWGMTNNVKQLTQEVHELKKTFVQEQTKLEKAPQQEGIPLIENPADIPWEEFNIGDIVELKSNGARFKVIGFEGDKFVQCEPLKKDIVDKIFDNFKHFRRNEIKKV